MTVVAGGPQPFATLNRVAVPLVRARFGAPLPLPGWTPGLIVLEVVGRRSGRHIRVPLLAANRGRRVLVTTVRAEASQWVRNLEHMHTARVWLRGRARSGLVSVFRGDRVGGDRVGGDRVGGDGVGGDRVGADTLTPNAEAPWIENPLDRALVRTLSGLGLGGALIDLDPAF